MRRCSFEVAVVLFTFVVGISAAGVGKYFIRNPAAHNCKQSPLRLPATGDVNPTAEAEIRELYRQYDIAQTRHDAEFFKRTETDTFVLTYRSGHSVTRAEAIEALNKDQSGTEYSTDDLNIQLHGDVAIVTGRMTAKHGNDQEGGFSSQWRWVDLLKNNSGRWQIMSTTQIDR